MGLPDDRITFVGHRLDYLLEDAILVTFPDQRYLYPDVVRGVAQDLREHMIDRRGGSQLVARRRIFASRQDIAYPKRRIANWSEVHPVLEAFGFEIVALGARSAEDQVRMFNEAEFVVGVHGSDLANLMFCTHQTSVLVIENERNVYHGISASLDILCQIVGARYSCLIADEAIDDQTDYSDFSTVHNRDVIVAPRDLEAALIGMGCQPLT